MAGCLLSKRILRFPTAFTLAAVDLSLGSEVLLSWTMSEPTQLDCPVRFHMVSLSVSSDDLSDGFVILCHEFVAMLPSLKTLVMHRGIREAQKRIGFVRDEMRSGHHRMVFVQRLITNCTRHAVED